MFKKVLVANRGEIAVQIIRALHEMDIYAVAVYSTADEDSLFVKLADEAVCIGGPQPKDSYLNMANIVSAANLTGCEAIHPGYGFLAENAEFAQLCQECNIKFIGPSPKMIDLMGNKAQARETMRNAGVPVIPGSQGMLKDVNEAHEIAEKIGYPVMIKAADGGGGKGIRQVQSAEELQTAFDNAKLEAQASFGNDDLYMEKIITDAKHIEMQVMADHFGSVIYFPERDCSMQRGNQKVIEESPCIQVSAAERATLGQQVSHAVKDLGYENTGTFEFLMDKNHRFYFMEMNTRLQVEHTVTEEVTGLELIKLQVLVANEQHLPLKQSDVVIKGHSIECRINAEDPAHGFQPSPGEIKRLYFPDGSMGVRIDSGVTTNSLISPFYDSMIAKLIITMPTRRRAINKMVRVLNEFSITGVKSNRDFLLALIKSPSFNNDQFNTKFVENVFLKEMTKNGE